ncbi:MAG: Fic family protein [Thermoplasmata archaeon]
MRRGGRTYYYLVHTYRWEGLIHKRQLYLGMSPPKNLDRLRISLEREVWKETWFRAFNEIKDEFSKRQSDLPPSVTAKEREDFVIDFTYDSNRIEGSTLTSLETANLVQRRVTPPSKPLNDVLESRSHAKLLERLLLRSQTTDLSHLLAWHRTIFSASKPDIAGTLRKYEVRIRGSRHTPPPENELRPMLIEMLRVHNRHGGKFHPVERAALFHLRFESIHPFGDGNGRIGRLAMNLILHQSGFPMLNVRYGKRRGYYHALERSDLAKTERPFLLWFFHRYVHDARPFSRRTK